MSQPPSERCIRKAKATDASLPPEPSSKRVWTLRRNRNKNVPQPLSELPYELQLRMLSFCDKKMLTAMSMVSNHWRNMSLRVIWETQPVLAVMQNFKQLDKHEDLRLAIRHLKVSGDCAPTEGRMKTVADRLATRLPQNNYPGLREFTIEFHEGNADQYIQIMNLLAANKPKNLKSLNIIATFKWSKSAIILDPKHENIVYPTGLTTIRVNCGYMDEFEWDPLLVFDKNKDTLTTVNLDLRDGYRDHFSLQPCLNVRTLTVHQELRDSMVAENSSIKFPNLEEIYLDTFMLPYVWREEVLVSTYLERALLCKIEV
ncbi:hypothetical protein AA313_de0203959 [Arthrobotrys entomopaga]|nr:hypothetical protein AA313_de0203959 [Arthrobotrys entomopaga]